MGMLQAVAENKAMAQPTQSHEDIPGLKYLSEKKKETWKLIQLCSKRWAQEETQSTHQH